MSVWGANARDRLRQCGVLPPRPPRLTPQQRRDTPWFGSVVAIDTEGSQDTDKYSATARWDEIDGTTHDERFGTPRAFSEFLIERSQYRFPTLIYAHNLDWDLQVTELWTRGTRLRYDAHTCRRNGSALKATFDYEGRHEHWRKIHIRDSFPIWPMSLAQLGKVVGLPKLRTPREYVPTTVDFRTGRVIETPEPEDDYDDDQAPRCDHGLIECVECYAPRDAAILHAAMRLYIAECDEYGLPPSLTRPSHAMRDFRTNHLPAPLTQYTERENLRAFTASRGGRSQMLTPGLTTATPDEVVVQADVVSQYAAIMAAGGFPDAAYHRIMWHPKLSRLSEITGFAHAEVTIPDMRLGPLIWRDERNWRTSYPVATTLQGAWTTDELRYARSLGCEVTLTRIEGCPDIHLISPFESFVAEHFGRKAAYDAEDNPRREGEKRTLTSLFGKFGMRWTEPLVGFVAITDPTILDVIAEVPWRASPEEPKRYPDYIMVPWSSLILARARCQLHAFGLHLLGAGARLLCCDTDSWTFIIARDVLASLPLGSGLGEFKLEADEYVAFRGAAPKEYALYRTGDELFRREPYKSRAKGIGGLASHKMKARAVDHYLRTGNVHFLRPNKTRGVARGEDAARFVHVEKWRHPAPPELLPLRYSEWPTEVRARLCDAEAQRLWLRRSPDTMTTDAGTSPAA